MRSLSWLRAFLIHGTRPRQRAENRFALGRTVPILVRADERFDPIEPREKEPRVRRRADRLVADDDVNGTRRREGIDVEHRVYGAVGAGAQRVPPAARDGDRWFDLHRRPGAREWKLGDDVTVGDDRERIDRHE